MPTVFISDSRGPCTQAIASHLADCGYSVVVNGETCPRNARRSAIALDDSAAINAFFDQFDNNPDNTLAGVIIVPPPPSCASIATTSEERWQQSFTGCVLPAFLLTQRAGKTLTRQGHGAVIFLGSIHAEKPTGFDHLHAENAAACQMLCREAALDFGTRGVGCYYVQRGVFPADLPDCNPLTNLYNAPELLYPARSYPSEDSLNGFIEFLLSPAATPLSGGDLRADFGMTMFYGWQVPETKAPPSPDALRQQFRRHHPVPPTVVPMPTPTPVAPSSRPPVALITGGGKGVGAGIAKVFAQAGYRVCIGFNTNRELAEKTLADISDAGGDAFIFQADIARRGAVQAMVAECVRRYAGIDVLVNNAALQPNLYIREYDAKTLHALWDINLGGYLRCTQECLPYLAQSPCPRIINISSIHGKRPSVFDVGYAMTKAAIRMFTREAALEFKDRAITVNAVDLGACKIEFKTGNYPFRLMVPPGIMRPSRRSDRPMTSPEDVGRLVLFLASANAAQINGAGIRIDGGAVLV
ncbi:MAG: SDR family oxidoreductase [Lentisphaerae bacterium]|nr:SDR family oxidoreductase [Lentisphaerota bacterium]